MSKQTHHRACHLCEAICGVVIETEGDQILSIKGDKDDPLSRGHICPKAVALQDIHNDPDRLRAPVRKVVNADGSVDWQQISWDEALATVAEKMESAFRQHGANAIGIYLGNPSVHNYGMLTHAGNLFRHFRSNNRFSATSVDQLPHHLVALWLYGHKFLIPIPDIDRTDYFLMLGANPLASNGSIWTVPDVRRRIKDLKARGGKLVVVDPRRTETAELASEHHFIRPGSDALFLAALVHTLFEEDLVDTGTLGGFVDGIGEIEAAIANFTPELAAEHSGIDAAQIRQIARDFAAAGAAICYGRLGVSVQHQGTLCQWLIQLINLLTGNIDRPGGSLFPTPAVDQIVNGSPGGFARHHSRVRGLPEFDRELPVATLAEEITTPGEGQIRVMFTGAGNPVLSTPNGRQLDRAFEQLEFMVSLDFYINETTRHADIILPPTSPLEHDHFDLAFHLLAYRNTARFNEPVFDKPEGALHDWEIFTELGNRVAELRGDKPSPAMPPHQMIDFGLRKGPYGEQGLNLDVLRANPSGVDLGALKPQLPQRLFTRDKRINLALPPLLGALDKLHNGLAPRRDGELLLIGRRHVRSNNSWMHNHHRLIKGKDRCTLLMNPQDMAERSIPDGGRVEIRSRVGELQVAAQGSDEMMPGVVSLPHGYGHGRSGVKMKIAQQNAGVSCNDLTDEHYLDAISGNTALNGVPVEVKAI